MLWFGKGLTNFAKRIFFLQQKILLRIHATLPVSSATAEKLFSTLQLIKSDIYEQLDSLCLMYIHNDISISTSVIIKKFAATRRKIKTLISCSVFMLQLL